MDAIKTYLDNVFAALPQTERVQALKRDMLAGMEEKYNELKWDGKSEHEAVGGVIANFGNIDEIIAELGIEQSAAGQKAPEGLKEPEEAIYVSGSEAEAYLAQTRKSSIGIGFGVWLILAGVSAMLAISGISEIAGITGEADDTFNAFGLFVLLLTIAAAVPMFIVSVMSLERYEHYNEKNIRLDTQTRAELELRAAQFMPRFIGQISIGVAVILLAVGVLIFLGTLGYGVLSIVILLLTIGFGVFLFITAGMFKGAFDVILGQGDYKYKERNKKAEKIIGTVAAVYWPLIVAIYLLWSFIGDAWATSWIMWPVAGVLFAAIAGGLGVWHYGTREK